MLQSLAAVPRNIIVFVSAGRGSGKKIQVSCVLARSTYCSKKMHIFLEVSEVKKFQSPRQYSTVAKKKIVGLGEQWYYSTHLILIPSYSSYTIIFLHRGGRGGEGVWTLNRRKLCLFFKIWKINSKNCPKSIEKITYFEFLCDETVESWLKIGRKKFGLSGRWEMGKIIFQII